jgi:hypothetical protein
MEVWSTNIKVRTQISAFLAGTFFAVILVFVSQEQMQKTLLSGQTLAVLTLGSFILTFVAFAFSTFAFGLSADFFRVFVDENQKDLEKRAKEAFYVGGSFFKVGYFFMMWSLGFLLALVHPVIGLFGILVFACAWAYLWKKTGPYELKKRKADEGGIRTLA